ncbi:hypothetical protein M153_3800002682 [Pseudoloma neurophilia]|uniref:Uncharacterized protein n=1 Tax=Pseudoloma neurophilia TaxID=146866 RepID=A0A0R0LXR1_9MICR|nr:hypothetical protein M153_3800002682 [Pseudoloma neurophilia]
MRQELMRTGDEYAMTQKKMEILHELAVSSRSIRLENTSEKSKRYCNYHRSSTHGNEQCRSKKHVHKNLTQRIRTKRKVSV